MLLTSRGITYDVINKVLWDIPYDVIKATTHYTIVIILIEPDGRKGQNRGV